MQHQKKRTNTQTCIIFLSGLGLENPGKISARSNHVEAMVACGWKHHDCGIGGKVHTSVIIEVNCGLPVVSIPNKAYEYFF